MIPAMKTVQYSVGMICWVMMVFREQSWSGGWAVLELIIAELVKAKPGKTWC
jgi:hypothetical protein